MVCGKVGKKLWIEASRECLYKKIIVGVRLRNTVENESDTINRLKPIEWNPEEIGHRKVLSRKK